MEPQRLKIFVVDDDVTILTVCKDILKSTYDTYPLPSAKAMFSLLETTTPDLILLDVKMSQMNGYEAARMLKERDDTKDIPIMFLTGLNDTQHEMKGLELGAVDFIRKPVAAAILFQRIKTHLAVAAKRKTTNSG